MWHLFTTSKLYYYLLSSYSSFLQINFLLKDSDGFLSRNIGSCELLREPDMSYARAQLHDVGTLCPLLSSSHQTTGKENTIIVKDTNRYF